MLLDIIAILITAVAVFNGIFAAIRERDTEPLIALWALVVVPVIWFVATALLGTALPHSPVYKISDLAAIQDGSSPSGSFFLGSGVIDSTQKYSWYQSQGDVYKLRSIEADQTEVRFTSGKPTVEYADDCEGPFTWLVECVVWNDYARFNVPQGSIKTNYTLDAK